MNEQLADLKAQAAAAAERMGHTLRGWSIPPPGAALHSNVCAVCHRAAVVNVDEGTVGGLAVAVTCAGKPE